MEGLADSVFVILALARKSWWGGLFDHVTTSSESLKALLNPVHFGAPIVVIDNFPFRLKIALIDGGLGGPRIYQKIGVWQSARYDSTGYAVAMEL